MRQNLCPLNCTNFQHAEQFQRPGFSDAVWLPTDKVKTIVKDCIPSVSKLPDWYGEVPQADRGTDLPHHVGQAQVLLCDRGAEQLIVTFGHSDDTNHPELDWPAWTDRLIRQRGWSHLAITAPKGNWYRDAALISLLEKLRDDGFFKRFDAVTFFGPAPQGSGFAALAFAALSPGAHVLAFDAQSTMHPKSVSWDDRFAPAKDADWTLPFGDATKSLRQVATAYIVIDPLQPLDRRHLGRLDAKRVMTLHGIGLYEDIGIAIKRLGLLGDMFVKAVAGTLTEADFYPKIRARKDLYLYRQVMERHLEARGKTAMTKDFIAAFRRRKRKAQADRRIETPVPTPSSKPSAPLYAPGLPDTPTAPALSGPSYPRTLGNVWALRKETSGFQYMSDQYQGIVMGFEERDETTLGETHPLAIGMAAFGHGSGIARDLPEDFMYHVVDEILQGRIAAFQAKSHGVIAQRLSAAHRHAYRTIIALTEPQSGITHDEALPDSPKYRALVERIATARSSLQGWNKRLYLDRISLSLLAGTPATPLNEALNHYATVAKAMRYDAAIAAGQASFPHIVVSQSAGTATDGRSDVILAEGQLDVVHPTLGFVVATPKYPFALVPDMPATHTSSAQMMIDELEVLAVAALQDNQRWYCPALRQAYGKDRHLVVEFAALSDLVMDDDFHGFAIEGAENAPQITDVRLHGKTVQLTLDQTPKGRDLRVTYAWGAHRATAGDGRAANRGALRDSWSSDSILQPKLTLHRHALSGRVRIMPSDLPLGKAGKRP